MKNYVIPPFLSTSFSEGGEKAKKRFANILNAGHRRVGVMAMAAALTLTLALGALVACGEKTDATKKAPEGESVSTENGGVYGDIDSALSAALLSERDKYAETEFWSEGHIILGSEADGTGGALKVYALTMVGGYSFMNGMFVKDSGSGVIPVVATVTEEEGGYSLDGLQYPKDGSYYLPSIEELFPQSVRQQALNANDCYDGLKAQEQARAEEYLKSIGREARVGEYADLDTRFPDISPEASNRLEDMKKNSEELNRFPAFIGTREYVENGERFVYETGWDPDAGTVKYDKYDGDGGLVFTCSVNADTGEAVSRGVRS